MVILLLSQLHLISQYNCLAGERDFAELSPAFLWLLRDFHLSLIDEQGRKVRAQHDLSQ
jgi:hypothetical protein